MTESRDRLNFESVRVLFVICTCATTLHSCYTRMHSFSVDQKRVIFSRTLLDLINSCLGIYHLGGCAIMRFCEALCNVINCYNIHLVI